ncbi:hypothetical protein OSTOST_07607, partial [Ostertagia ostertagi]
MNINKFSAVFTVTRPSDQPAPTSRDQFVFKNRTRFIILLICTLCLSIAQSNTLTLNFTVICMAGDPINFDQYNASGTIFQTTNGTYYETGSSTHLLEYEDAVFARRHYAYTPNEKNMLFSFVAIGAMVAVYPVMWLIQVMGFPVEQTGLFSAIPQIVTFVLKMFAGVLADKATCCRPVTSVKIFNLLAIGGMGIAFFILAVIP